MIKVAIIGSTGYTGVELLRILQNHPSVQVAAAITESYVDQALAQVYPHLKGQVDLLGEKLEIESLVKNCDLVFIALPHGHAIKIVPTLLAAGKKVIDLGADFRLKNPEHYQNWYQQPSAAAELLNQAVYGLAEAGWRSEIMKTSFVANPGCYPTAAALATIPALKADIIDPNECIFDAKSGVSGAGRSPALHTHYCEVTENLAAYQIAGQHRHTPEIEQTLGHIINKSVTVQFTPHLVPMIRGLLVTAYFKLAKSISEAEIYALYQAYYQDEPFIRISPPGKIPAVKQVRGTNYCDIGLQVDTRTQRLIVVSVIDNLIKGASGQAVQNMNLMMQLPENTGLTGNITVYP